MAWTGKITEGSPDGYPYVTGGPSDPAMQAVVWQRIEAWISYRWRARSVVFIAEGPGAWVSPLEPTTISTTEIWEGSAWHSAELEATPLGGLYLPNPGPFRLTGTAGSAATPPEAVQEAVRRLWAFLERSGEFPCGVTREEMDSPGFRHMTERPASWAARALQYSGAADLLRPYRRLGR